MDFSAFSETAAKYRVLGVKVTQDGQSLFDWLAEPDIRRNMYSAAKSFTSAAVGFAVQEGLISLRKPLTAAFRGDIPAHPDEHLQSATVRDLLTMCLGQEKNFLTGDMRPRYADDNWVRMALARPFAYAPGTHFVYSNVGPYLAGVLVQRRAGCDLVDYLTPRLLQPLGIKKPMWETDPNGYTFGSSGLFLTLEELHRFGLFYLANGCIGGEQLLSAEWIAESTAPSDTEKYGYLFWRGPYSSYRADGKFGQLSIVLPEKHAVVSVTAECRQTDALRKAVFAEICSQL